MRIRKHCRGPSLQFVRRRFQELEAKLDCLIAESAKATEPECICDERTAALKRDVLQADPKCSRYLTLRWDCPKCGKVETTVELPYYRRLSDHARF